MYKFDYDYWKQYYSDIAKDMFCDDMLCHHMNWIKNMCQATYINFLEVAVMDKMKQSFLIQPEFFTIGNVIDFKSYQQVMEDFKYMSHNLLNDLPKQLYRNIEEWINDFPFSNIVIKNVSINDIMPTLNSDKNDYFILCQYDCNFYLAMLKLKRYAHSHYIDIKDLDNEFLLDEYRFHKKLIFSLLQNDNDLIFHDEIKYRVTLEYNCMCRRNLYSYVFNNTKSTERYSDYYKQRFVFDNIPIILFPNIIEFIKNKPLSNIITNGLSLKLLMGSHSNEPRKYSDEFWDCLYTVVKNVKQFKFDKNEYFNKYSNVVDKYNKENISNDDWINREVMNAYKRHIKYHLSLFYYSQKLMSFSYSSLNIDRIIDYFPQELFKNIEEFIDNKELSDIRIGSWSLNEIMHQHIDYKTDRLIYDEKIHNNMFYVLAIMNHYIQNGCSNKFAAFDAFEFHYC